MLKRNNQKRGRTYLFISFIFLFIMVFVGFPSSVSAQETPAEPAPALPQDVANIIWLSLTGFLIFSFQHIVKNRYPCFTLPKRIIA